VIEIRRYTTAEGRDVFGEWVANLADLKARARIAVRIDRLAGGNSGDSKSIGESLHELRIDWGPGYRVYYGKSKGLACCCCAEEINANSLRTSRKRERIGRTTRKGRRWNEAQTQYFS
jgi:putative addiction module killer protein